jgi:hypothetical protein
MLLHPSTSSSAPISSLSMLFHHPIFPSLYLIPLQALHPPHLRQPLPQSPPSLQSFPTRFPLLMHVCSPKPAIHKRVLSFTSLAVCGPSTCSPTPRSPSPTLWFHAAASSNCYCLLIKQNSIPDGEKAGSTLQLLYSTGAFTPPPPPLPHPGDIRSCYYPPSPHQFGDGGGEGGPGLSLQLLSCLGTLSSLPYHQLSFISCTQREAPSPYPTGKT